MILSGDDELASANKKRPDVRRDFRLTVILPKFCEATCGWNCSKNKKCWIETNKADALL